MATALDELTVQAAETVEMSAAELDALMGAARGEEVEDSAGDHSRSPMPAAGNAS